MDENDDYSYSWSNSFLSSVSSSGDVTGANDNSGSSGSSSFSHHELGSYSNGGGLGDNGGYNPPTLSSTFTNNETDSFTASNQDSANFTDGSPTGGDGGYSTHNDSTSYTHNYFEQGSYGGSSAGWWVSATFNDKESGIDTAGDTENGNYSNAAGEGQVNGGQNASDSVSVSFSNSQTGQYSLDDGVYQETAAFHYREQGSESDSDYEQGNDSSNMGASATAARSAIPRATQAAIR